MINTKEISRVEELNNRGIFFIKTKQEQEALKYFNRAIENNSDYLNSYFNKAIVFKTLQKFDEAIECYNIILRKEPKQGQAYFEKANVLFFNKNDVKTAAKLYNKAVFLGVKNPEIYFCLGLCSEAIGSRIDELRWIERAIRVDDKRTDFILKEAETLVALGRYSDAIKSYDKVLMLDADNESAYHYKIKILGVQGKYDEAFAVLKCGELLMGEKVMFQYDKALLFESKQKYQEAFDAIEKGLEINKDNIKLLLKEGLILISLDKCPQAKISFEKIIELEPNNIEGYFNLANVCFILQEFDEALEIFNSIISKTEDNPYKINSYYYKALILKKLGKNEETKQAYNFALKYYNIILLDYPNDLKLNLIKANTLRDIGRYDEAEKLYAYVIDLDKEMAEAYFNRAKNFKLLCKTDETKKALYDAIAINPGYKKLIKLDEDLKNYIC